MKTPVSHLSLLILTLILSLGNVSAKEYFVASGGNDTADGQSVATAFATVQKGLDTLAAGDTLTFEPGEYEGPASRKDLGNLKVETLIRARIPGTVTVRGDEPAPEFQPLEGHPHVYVADFPGPVEAVNEVDSLKILSNVPDPGEVAFSPGSFSFDPEKKKLFISTTDMRLAEAHRYTISVASGHGLVLINPIRVTVDGLTFRGFNSLEPLRDSRPQNTVWGLYLDGAKDCIIRNCRAFLSSGGILIRPSKDGGGNLIEDCEAYATMAPHSVEMGAISIFGPHNDTIRNSTGYLSNCAGIRLYGSPFTGVNSLENCLVWGTLGRGLDMKGSLSDQRGFNRNSVGLGLVNGYDDNISHNIIGVGNVYVPLKKISRDNVVLSRDGLKLKGEFADPTNFDFRLQSTSSLRGAAPDGSDRGPFPYTSNVFYVHPGGNDEADGLSIGTAWKTSARAVRDLQAGDTLYFGRGHYAGSLTIPGGKAGKEPLRLRARGEEVVVLDGPVTLTNGEGVEFERLRFAGTVTLEGGRDLSFKNCRFAGEEEGLVADGVTDLRVSHGEFLGSKKSGLLLRDCSAVQLTDNIFDNANGVGVAVTKAPEDKDVGVEKVIAFSDRNAYAESDRAWSWNGKTLSLAELPDRRDAHSFVSDVSLGEDKGFPLVANPEVFGGRGTDGKGVGFYQDLLANELFMSAPTLHSVSATTANIEWLVSRGADCEVAWGETSDCENEEQFTINTPEDCFRSFSLTGLKPGTTYYFRIKSIQLLKYPDHGTAEVKDPKYEMISFTTLAKDAPPQVYYVAPDGSNKNSGLERSQAWKTVSHAAGAVAPGDTVMVASGTYSERVRVRVTGDKGKPIRFLNIPGERVVFDGIHRRLLNAWTITGKTNIAVDGFYFDNHRGFPGGSTSTRLFNVVASRDILIRRCLMDGRGGGAYPASFLTGWNTENLTISNSVSILAPDGIEINACPGFRLEHSVFVLTMICNVKLSSSATLESNIFCDSGKFKSEANVHLAQYGDPQKIVDQNNCYYFRLPTDKRTAFFVHTSPRDADKPWERITLPALKLRVPGNDSIVADPEFAVLKDLPAEKRTPFSVDALGKIGEVNFADLFTTNPELIKRGIGLQPEVFADFTHDPEPAGAQ